MSNSGIHRGLRGNRGAKDIIVGTLHHIFFDHRYLLVGSYMIDRLNAEAIDHRIHQRSIADVTQHRHNLGAGAFCPQSLQFKLQVVESKLKTVQQYQALWFQTNNLPTQLRTDGASRSRNQYRAASNAGAHQLYVRRYNVTTQQVFNVDVAHFINMKLA